jgi:hypothetical protein
MKINIRVNMFQNTQASDEQKLPVQLKQSNPEVIKTNT